MLDSWESFTASRVTTRNYDGWLHGENAVKGWSCHAWCRATCCDATWCGPATWCGDHLCCCTSVPAAPNIPWPAAGRWCSSFLFFPSRSPASQQKPRGCKRDSVRAPVVLHPKSASRRRMPVVTATVTSPHAFVCLYALLSPFRFFFSSLVAENLALRLADACIHQCSTRVRLCHLGADLFVGGFPFIAYMDSLDRHT